MSPTPTRKVDESKTSVEAIKQPVNNKKASIKGKPVTKEAAKAKTKSANKAKTASTQQSS